MAKKATQFVHVRIPKDLHRKLQREAERRGMTLNAEILRRIELAEGRGGAVFETTASVSDVVTEIPARVTKLETEVPKRMTRLEKALQRMTERMEALKAEKQGSDQ